jgi:outer membrane protein assembly factor BamB
MRSVRLGIGVAVCMILVLTIMGCQSYGEPTAVGRFPLRERWRFEAEDAIITELAGGYGKVAIRTGQKLYVLDASTGILLWAVPVPADVYPTPPLVGEDLIVVGYSDGVMAMDAKAGREVWRAQNKASCESPRVVPIMFNKNLVYVVRDHCDVRAYDRASGNLIWTGGLSGARSGANLFLDRGELLVASGEVLQVRNPATGGLVKSIGGQIGENASYQAGILYGFRSSTQLVAFDPRPGKALWTAEGMFDISSPPVVAGSFVLALPYGEQVPSAYDALTGTQLWSAQVDRGSYLTPAVLSDTVYVRGLFNGKIYALSLLDGKPLGYLDTGGTLIVWGESSAGQPIVADGLLIIPLGRGVYAYGR